MKEKMQKAFIKVEINQRPIVILGKVAKEPECSEILTYGEFCKKADTYILEYDELDDYKNYYFRDYKNFEDFMAKRSASQFMVKKSVDKAIKEEKPNSQLNQKEIRRKAAQDRARVKECEREIERLQEQLDKYQLDMQNPDIVSDHEKMAQLWQNMETDRQKMDQLMDEWAELAERLEG